MKQPNGVAARTAAVEPDAPAPENPVVELSAEELPAACPNSRTPLWSSHPRVYLEVVNEREAVCSYCGTRYRLRPGARVHDDCFGTPNMHQHHERP